MTDDPPAHQHQTEPSWGFRHPPQTTAKIMALREAFINLFDYDYQFVVRFLMRCGASLEDSKDAAQDAFTEGWRLLSRQPEAWEAITEPRGWIRAVALRAYRRTPGRHRRQVLLTEEVGFAQQPASSGDLAGSTALRHDLLIALRALADDQRIVMAFRLEDLPSAAAAGYLEITEQQVNDLLKKARANLKTALAVYRTQEGDRR